MQPRQKSEINKDCVKLAEKILHDIPDRRKDFHVRVLADAIDLAVMTWLLHYAAEISPEIFEKVTGIPASDLQ